MSRIPDFEPVTALEELVEIYSVTDTPPEQGALDWTARQFLRMGIDYERVPKIGGNGQTEFGQYAAIIAKVAGRRSNNKTAIISNGHIDVVEKGEGWTQTEGEMDGSIMYGRGTTDMKSAVVAQIEAARQARDSQDLPFDHYIMVVAGEETTGWGTKQAVDWSKNEWFKYNNLAAIIPEPTHEVDSSGRGETRVMFGNKGCFSAQITIPGDTGHAAESLGKTNSIEVGADIIHALRPLREEWNEAYRDSGLGLPALTFTREIAGLGLAPNSLPPENILRLDGRYPRELMGKYEEDLRKALETFIADGVDFKILYFADPAYTDPSHPWVKANLQAFDQKNAGLPLWTTDGCFFTDYEYGRHEGIPLVIAGPGYLNMLHKPDERCDTAQIVPWAERFLEAGRNYVDSLRSSGILRGFAKIS